MVLFVLSKALQVKMSVKGVETVLFYILIDPAIDAFTKSE